MHGLKAQARCFTEKLNIFQKLVTILKFKNMKNFGDV